MPGLMLFGRRWAIGSDYFVFSGAFELFIRVTCWIGILVLYSLHKGHFNCTRGGLLNNYLLILLILLAFNIAALSSITYISMQGTISNPGPRKSLPKLLYVRLALYIPELVWAVVRTVWIADKQVNCKKAMISAISGTVIVSWANPRLHRDDRYHFLRSPWAEDSLPYGLRQSQSGEQPVRAAVLQHQEEGHSDLREKNPVVVLLHCAKR